ncbi:hypothetical protein ACOMHN_029373 [Nucella lapillus]
MESPPISQTTTTPFPSPSSSSKTSPSSSFEGTLPLWKRVLVCSGMLALESYISYEEIYLTTTLQRLEVPYALLSFPGAVSGGLGIFVIPLLGWAMDRYRGSKRVFICGTLLLLSLGMAILIYTGSVSLYHADSQTVHPYPNQSFVLDDGGNNITGSELVPSNQSFALQNGGYNITGTDLVPSNQSFAHKDGGNNGTGSELVSTNQSVAVNEERQGYTGDVVTMSGAIALAGFTIGNHGYDTSTLSLRTYVLHISREPQHDSLLLTFTMMGAIGGCVTSLIGFLDLSGVFPQLEGQTIDKGDAQFLVQSVIFVVVLVLFCSCTILSNRKLLENETTSLFTLFSRNKNQNNHIPLKEEEEVLNLYESEVNNFAKNSGTNSNIYESQGEGSSSGRPKNVSVRDGSFEDFNSSHDKHELCTELELHSEGTEKAGDGSPQEQSTGCISRRTKSRLSLMVMAFFVISAMASYFFFITNYVAEVIYEGNPHAPAESDAYNQYVFGTRMASLSMLIFYVVFVIYNFFHGKILDKVGMRGEFIITSLSVTVLTLILVLTESMVMVFVAMVPLAAYRSCCLTVPFILANKYAQREHREMDQKSTTTDDVHIMTTTNLSPPPSDKKNKREGHNGEGGRRSENDGGEGKEDGDGGGEGGRDDGGGEGSVGSGSAMASVTVMIPLTYCLLSVVSGPLIALTSNTALPIYISIGAYGLGTLSAAVVDFDSD